MPLISEPMTTLTDYALAAASLGFFVAMRRSIGPRNRVSAWFWCAAFVAAAAGAVLGGTYHGFAAYLDAHTRAGLWNVAVFSMGACAAFVVAGIHAASVKREDGTWMWLGWGVGVTVLGGAVQQAGLPLSESFNHNDAYHLIQIVGLYFLFRCARTVRDRPGIQGDPVLVRPDRQA